MICKDCNGTGHIVWYEGNLDPDRNGFTYLEITVIHCKICKGMGTLLDKEDTTSPADLAAIQHDMDELN